MLPIYGSDNVFDNDTPLREYIWDEDTLPETDVEYPYERNALFVPGLASIAPCTSENYNLRLGDERGWSASNDDGGVHRATHPHAGAFSYRHNVTYVAVRDIAAGEELTVECEDASFDGGAYYLSRYDASSVNDHRITCLDQNLRVDVATKATSFVDDKKENENNKNDPMGLGVFAKRSLMKGERIISSPLVPVHRNEMDIVDDEDVNGKQLMLNYVFGHPDSDLLLLSIGPIVNFINHKRKTDNESDGGANVEIRWYHNRKDGDDSPEKGIHQQEYHHAGLFYLPAETVAATHGKGLVMDIVAIRDVSEGEEIYLDYGEEWQTAWDAHVASFEKLKRNLSPDDLNYISADRQMKLISGVTTTIDNKENKIKDGGDALASYYYRIDGIEQQSEPYPENTDFFCFYHLHDDDDNDDDVDDASSSGKTRENNYIAEELRHFSWEEHSSHPCLRSCTLVKRHPYKQQRENGFGEDDNDHDKSTIHNDNEPVYTVIMFRDDNDKVTDNCAIGTNYVYEDVPQSEIRLLDRPYTTDLLSPFAFRHEIGVPEGFYPESWIKTKQQTLRSRWRVEYNKNSKRPRKIKGKKTFL